MSLRKVLMLTRAWDVTIDLRTLLAHLDDESDDDVMRPRLRPPCRTVREPLAAKEHGWRWRPRAMTG